MNCRTIDREPGWYVIQYCGPYPGAVDVLRWQDGVWHWQKPPEGQAATVPWWFDILAGPFPDVDAALSAQKQFEEKVTSTNDKESSHGKEEIPKDQ